MDLSCKRNTEAENHDEPTSVNMDTKSPVETSETSGASMNERTNLKEAETSQNQEKLILENNSNEIYSKTESITVDKTEGGDKIEGCDKIDGGNETAEGVIKEGEDKTEESEQTEQNETDQISNETEKEVKNEKGDKQEEFETDVRDLEKKKENVNESEKIDFKDKLTSEIERKNIELENKNVENNPSENLKTNEENDSLEMEAECSQKEKVVQDSCSNVVEKENDSLEMDAECSQKEKEVQDSCSNVVEKENDSLEMEAECSQKEKVVQDSCSNVVEKEKDLEEEEAITEEMITDDGEEKKEETKEENTKEKEESLSMPPENLFEYQWPAEIMGEWYFVQEQICEYIGVTSFKRKYPDLERRVMDMKEKEFLRERGVVTEEQVTLGLTALKSEDVYDLMAKDYNKKYTDYLKILQEKERQNISNKRKEYEAPTMDTEKVKEYTKRAVRQAAEYNASLMRERREERQYFLDMQTMVVQVSKNRLKQIKKESTKVDGYPVALIPGQFQNFYRKYTPEELNFFPLQTAMYGPVAVRDQRKLGRPGWENEDEPLSDISEPGSPEPSSALPTINVPPPVISMVQPEMPQKEQHHHILGTYKPKEIDNAICGLCLKDKTCNKFNLAEELIHCAQCDNSGHPSCLEMNDDLVIVIKTYPWQCMECKTCFCCGQPTDEDKMMFCDDCDRGYHTFCVGLQEIPTGKWACPSCLAAQAKEKELATVALLAAAAAVPTPEPVAVSTPTATQPPIKRRKSAKKRDL